LNSQHAISWEAAQQHNPPHRAVQQDQGSSSGCARACATAACSSCSTSCSTARSIAAVRCSCSSMGRQQQRCHGSWVSGAEASQQQQQHQFTAGGVRQYGQGVCSTVTRWHTQTCCLCSQFLHTSQPVTAHMFLIVRSWDLILGSCQQAGNTASNRMPVMLSPPHSTSLSPSLLPPLSHRTPAPHPLPRCTCLLPPIVATMVC
jgi:hypothetical protein